MNFTYRITAERSLDDIEVEADEFDPGMITVDESEYESTDCDIDQIDVFAAEFSGGEITTRLCGITVQFLVSIEVERTSGRFVSKDDLDQEITSEFPDSITLYGMDFEITDVELQETPKRGKR